MLPQVWCLADCTVWLPQISNCRQLFRSYRNYTVQLGAWPLYTGTWSHWALLHQQTIKMTRLRRSIPMPKTRPISTPISTPRSNSKPRIQYCWPQQFVLQSKCLLPLQAPPLLVHPLTSVLATHWHELLSLKNQNKCNVRLYADRKSYHISRGVTFLTRSCYPKIGYT